jgi:acyl carrier protein
MDNTQDRLIRCFSAIFPTLSREQILAADASKMESWDSVASVTLFAMIEEEFGVEIEIQGSVDLLSYRKISEYLNGANLSNATGQTPS